MAFEHYSLVKPARSSDIAFFVQDTLRGTARTVFGVVDTIGKPHSRQLARFIYSLQKQMQDLLSASPATSAADLTHTLQEFLNEGNETILRMSGAKKDSIFGLCIVLTAVIGNEYLVFGLGDCRAYHLSSGEDISPGERAACLSSDQNELASILETQKEYALLQNELSELSRVLTCHWGTPIPDQIRDRVAHARTGTIKQGDILVCFTDGIYLPVVRSVMDLTKCTLTRDHYYLEYWMSQVYDQIRSHCGEEFRLEDYADGLIEHCVVSSAFRRKRYRDDIALVAVRPGRPREPSGDTRL